MLHKGWRVLVSSENNKFMDLRLKPTISVNFEIISPNERSFPNILFIVFGHFGLQKINKIFRLPEFFDADFQNTHILFKHSIIDKHFVD